MKPIVIKWIYDVFMRIVSATLELFFRIALFLLPLGVFMTILQFRGKVSKTSNLSTFTTDNSVWQHVFPGFILVAIDPEQFKTLISLTNNKFQNWIKMNKYSLIAFAISTIIVLMILEVHS